MSNNALVIASVTAIVKRLLDNELIRQFAHAPIGDVTITALPPDRIPTGAEERTQLNLYLYRVTPNSSRYRTHILDRQEPSIDSPPLALNLHYLLTAYGERDFQAEALLGCIIQFFHETPVLTQDILRSTIASLSINGIGGGTHPLVERLADSTLADQLESIKITPEFLSMEEMSRLWSSLQTRSRPSMTYQASMVFIGGTRNSTEHTNEVQVTTR